MNHSPSLVLAAAALVTAMATAPAPASAAPAAVSSGAANWSIPNVYDTAAPTGTNRTWLGYVTASFTGGTATGADGLLLSGPTALPVATVDGTAPRGADQPFTFGFPVASGGTVDVAAKALDVTTAGTVQFETHGTVIALRSPRVVLAGDGTGAVSVAGGSTSAGTTTPFDATTPLFTLDASAATFRQIGDQLVQISGLVPAIAKTDVFGPQYAVGAGPNRTPNTFGSFSVVVSTAAPLAPVERTVEKIVERPVERTSEKTVTVDKTSVAVKATLTKKAFGTSAPIEVTIRAAGSGTPTLGEGYVAGAKLTAFLPKGTTLAGKYVLTRTSGAKKLPRSTTVTVATKTAKATKR